MQTIHKLVARNVATGRQHQKWQYIGDAKFDKHSPEIIERYTNLLEYRGDCYDVEHYILDNDGDWEYLYTIHSKRV